MHVLLMRRAHFLPCKHFGYPDMKAAYSMCSPASYLSCRQAHCIGPLLVFHCHYAVTSQTVRGGASHLEVELGVADGLQQVWPKSRRDVRGGVAVHVRVIVALQHLDYLRACVHTRALLLRSRIPIACMRACARVQCMHTCRLLKDRLLPKLSPWSTQRSSCRMRQVTQAWQASLGPR